MSKVSFKNAFRILKKQILNKEFSNMNVHQREAVFSVNGPVIVLAGAGSGKTTAIINRIVNMIKFGDAYNAEEVPENLNQETMDKLQKVDETGELTHEVAEIIKFNPVKPWNILAITFTNKAANELKTRLCNALGEDVGNQVWASTFHSLCVRILRANAEKLGYTNHFVVYDDDDTKKLIKECQKILKIDDKMLNVKSVKYEVSRAKDQLIDSEAYKKSSGNDFRLAKIADVYELYQKKLQESDAMDFDDLIVNTIALFKNYPEVLQHYQEKFKYIMVDEYQDTNYAQYVLINALSQKYRNLCVVGDDDQSIYKFRGATIENIINFEKHFPGAKVVRLEQNYRSTKNILNAANAVIGNNTTRKGKTLWTENAEGDKIKVHTAYSEHDEAHYMAEAVQDAVARGGKYADFAILYRMNSQSNVIEKMFMKSGIPYRMLGGMRFYERKEIRDMIAYLSIINNPLDEIRLKRVINQPRRSIGERTIAQASEIAAEMGTDLLSVIRDCEKHDSLQRVSVKLKSFSDLIDGLIDDYQNSHLSLHELYEEVLKRTDYISFLKSENDCSESRIENVKELMNNIIKYEEDNPDSATLAGFLEEVSLVSDVDNYDADADAVVMMTLHSAKGLEFPNVFIPGFEEGIFPGIQSMNSDEEIEEERRLAYVGITRSREKLYILNSGSRMIFGSTSHNKASRFLGEIPEELMEKTKSRDWKALKAGEEAPRSAQEMRLKSVLAARHFGQVTGGTASQQPKDVLACGQRVTHKKFGEGTVVAVQAMGGDSLIEVAFVNPEIGNKKLMANFANLTRI